MIIWNVCTVKWWVRHSINIWGLSKWSLLGDDTSKCIFQVGNISILIEISLKFVHVCPVDKKSSLAQVTDWCYACDRPLCESTMTQFIDTQAHTYIYMHICLHILILVTLNNIIVIHTFPHSHLSSFLLFPIRLRARRYMLTTRCTMATALVASHCGVPGSNRKLLSLSVGFKAASSVSFSKFATSRTTVTRSVEGPGLKSQGTQTLR